MSVYSIDS